MFVATGRLRMTLIENDALDGKRAAHHGYGVLRRVADDARDAILTPPKNAKTVCGRPLFDDELQQPAAGLRRCSPRPRRALGGMLVRRVRGQPGAADEHVSQDALGGERASGRRGVRAAERRLFDYQAQIAASLRTAASACAGGRGLLCSVRSKIRMSRDWRRRQRVADHPRERPAAPLRVGARARDAPRGE